MVTPMSRAFVCDKNSILERDVRYVREVGQRLLGQCGTVVGTLGGWGDI